MRSHKEQYLIELERIEEEYPSISPDEQQDMAMQAATDYLLEWGDYLHDIWKENRWEK